MAQKTYIFKSSAVTTPPVVGGEPVQLNQGVSIRWKEEFDAEGYKVDQTQSQCDLATNYWTLGFASNNESETVPVIYENWEQNNESGTDMYFYEGTGNLTDSTDNTVYDKWRKIEEVAEEGNNYFTWDSSARQYVYTDRIILESVESGRRLKIKTVPVEVEKNLRVDGDLYVVDELEANTLYASESISTPGTISANGEISSNTKVTAPTFSGSTTNPATITMERNDDGDGDVRISSARDHDYRVTPAAFISYLDGKAQGLASAQCRTRYAAYEAQAETEGTLGYIGFDGTTPKVWYCDYEDDGQDWDSNYQVSSSKIITQEDLDTLDFSSPSASGTATSFITAVSQTNGKISAAKSSLPTATAGTNGAAGTAGIVALIDSIESESTTAAATADAVRRAYNRASSALEEAQSHPEFTLNRNTLTLKVTIKL